MSTPSRRLGRRKLVIGLGAGVGAIVAGRAAAAAAFSYPAETAGRVRRFASLEEALAEVRRLSHAGPVRTTGAWSWAQILTHNAQGIEYSVRGYPEYKPALFRRTVGRWVHARFAEQGYMRHDLAAPIPAAPVLDDVSQDAALARLEAAVAAFRRHATALAAHFVYGELDKPRFEQVHVMHLADHLTEVSSFPLRTSQR